MRLHTVPAAETPGPARSRWAARPRGRNAVLGSQRSRTGRAAPAGPAPSRRPRHRPAPAPLTCPAPSRRSASRTASCPPRSPWRRHLIPLAAPARSLRLHSPPFLSTEAPLSAAILGQANNPAPYSPLEEARRFEPVRSELAAEWVRPGQWQRGDAGGGRNLPPQPGPGSHRGDAGGKRPGSARAVTGDAGGGPARAVTEGMRGAGGAS